jgi:polysaccharide export outer membrane protein
VPQQPTRLIVVSPPKINATQPASPSQVRISAAPQMPPVIADERVALRAPEAKQNTMPMPAPADAPAIVENKTAPDSLPPQLQAQMPAVPPLPMTNSSFLPANPESYCYRCGVQCPPCGCNPGGPGWAASRPIPWEVFAQGEYIGPARLAHVPVYRLRVDDRLAFVYRLSGQVAGQPYRLNVRDRILVQSLSAPEVVNRELLIEPDGTITLPLLGQVRAAGSTVEELGKALDEQFKRQIKDPRITVTPLVMNSNLEELRASVDRRYGAGGQVSDARISPDGTLQLPAIGSVPAQGLTLEELEREVKARYALIVEGLEVTPILLERAPRFIYILGEVKSPGRYTMEGPTTVMGAISMAGSWNVGAGTNEIVVFRRDENWHLMATKVNVRTSLLFKKPCPEGEIWLRDSDVVLVPKSPILCADDFIELVFTRGIYGVFPMSAQLNFTKISSL